jgi:fatty aldehyde-generating acyl-ACP reductase
LAPEAGSLLLIGRNNQPLQELAHELRATGAPEVQVATEIERVTEAHLVITVTNAVDAVIEAHHLRHGAVVCDVARPRDVSRQVVEKRRDVLVIEGGMVEVPGPVNFGFNFGFPPKMAYACMAETMALALDQNYVSFTLGKRIELSQVLTIDTIASRHGFKLGGFRTFERAVTQAEIAGIKAQLQIGQTSVETASF